MVKIEDQNLSFITQNLCCIACIYLFVLKWTLGYPKSTIQNTSKTDFRELIDNHKECSQNRRLYTD